MRNWHRKRKLSWRRCLKMVEGRRTTMKCVVGRCHDTYVIAFMQTIREDVSIVWWQRREDLWRGHTGDDTATYEVPLRCCKVQRDHHLHNRVAFFLSSVDWKNQYKNNQWYTHRIVKSPSWPVRLRAPLTTFGTSSLNAMQRFNFTWRWHVPCKVELEPQGTFVCVISHSGLLLPAKKTVLFKHYRTMFILEALPDALYCVLMSVLLLGASLRKV